MSRQPTPSAADLGVFADNLLGHPRIGARAEYRRRSRVGEMFAGGELFRDERTQWQVLGGLRMRW